jgi:peptidoglycan hydrolase-like protein with peptidoglycan-binding domain
MMETFALLQVAVDYEDPNLAVELRSPQELLTPLTVGAVAIGVALSQLPAQALMRYGDAGNGVSSLQKQLNIKADGIYGEQTYQRVRSFQAGKGLRIDGVAGPATLAALGLNSTLVASGNTSGGNQSKPSETPVASSAVVTARTGLIVRNRPNGSNIGGVDRGVKVSLTGDRQAAGGRNWVQLAQGGWIAEEYISYGGSGGIGGGDPEVPVASGAYVAARSGLIVRNQPNGYQIGGLGTGQRVALTGASRYAGGRSWLQLQGGGWVAEDYIAYQ